MPKYKYTVIEIDLPEWETGEVIEKNTFDDPELALAECKKLNDNIEGYFEVIIEKAA